MKYEQFEEGLRSHHQHPHAGHLKAELASSFDEYNTERDEEEEEREEKQNVMQLKTEALVGESLLAESPTESERRRADMSDGAATGGDVMAEQLVRVDIKHEQLPAPGKEALP